ncbi:Uncharacterised protein [Mesomycoplasma conjunctivae]|uniref:Lipoprotein n=1 Tax=Mesomycoplasma conjunctivae (strain ATCC 25834 / NCTC 10147 / HRC/581) TaxID=572263 RepID=C5J6B6_MESCH|nr:hypothetical protein [Mesomycoplasma conjunctivae]CAT05008.1 HYPOTHETICAL PROTEIN MCJ_003170 [Mesomycoplasma conjunctivae]VEU66333.1 Uncharacterised protein [Mesomycoplasma conjunctivae]
MKWIKILVLTTTSLLFLTSCIEIDYHRNENVYQQETKDTTTNSLIVSNQKARFASVVEGQVGNQVLTANYLNLASSTPIDWSKLGQHDVDYQGFEKVATNFFNIVKIKNQEGLNNSVINKFLKLKDIDFVFSFERPQINNSNSEFDFPAEDNNFENQVDLDVSKLKKFEQAFAKNELEIMKANNPDLFFSQRENFLFFEQLLIDKQQEWNPNLKTLFANNLFNNHLVLISKTQKLIQKIILEIIEVENFSKLVINEIIDKLNKEKVAKEAKKNKANKDNPDLSNSHKTSNQEEKEEEMITKQELKILEDFKTNIQNLNQDIANFLDPAVHFSISKKYVFLNDESILVNNQLFYKQIINYYNQYLRKYVTYFQIRNPFNLLTQAKQELIDKYFYPLIDNEKILIN